MGWWPDGRIYEGDFSDGRKHGEGTLKWPDGRSYSGQWCEGKQHGTAMACTARGLKRQSQWKDGKFIDWIGAALEGSPAAGLSETSSPSGLPALTCTSDAEPPLEARCRERRKM